MSLHSMIAKSWRIDRPGPMPPNRLVVEVSAWLKRRNSSGICASVVPVPTSRAAKISGSLSREDGSATVPFSMNFAVF